MTWIRIQLTQEIDDAIVDYQRAFKNLKNTKPTKKEVVEKILLPLGLDGLKEATEQLSPQQAEKA